MDCQSTVIFDEAELAKSVHEEAYPGAGRPDDSRQRFLAHLRDDRLRSAFLPEIGQQEKYLSMANCQIGLSAVVFEVLIPLPECATSLSYSFI
jgi:hypothetical protein